MKDESINYLMYKSITRNGKNKNDDDDLRNYLNSSNLFSFVSFRLHLM